MPPAAYKLVLDTNVILRGLASSASLSGRILQACEQRIFITLHDKPVLAEYRRILIHSASPAAFPP